jgi:hypothetical protein
MNANEFLRPWKLLTLAAGIALLVAGSFYYQAPDWDIGISLVMAVFTYFGAPWAMRTLLAQNYKAFPAMIFVAWWCVDGCYALYWWVKDPVALAMMRDVNWPASLCLFLICGLLWAYQGSLSELKARFKASDNPSPTP